MAIESQRKVWFITGTSSGFGKRLVYSVLARGDYVIATVRNPRSFVFPEGDTSRLRVIKLDVSDTVENVQRAVETALQFWRRIDVLVNNAGFGVKSLLEEGGVSAALTQFQTNVIGVINVTNAILPYMRERRSGIVVMMGSRSVWKADTPTAGYYVASKAAVHALGEAYACELAQFNVRVLICAPGAFRTENVHNVPYTYEEHIPDYNKLREASISRFKDIQHNAQGDPDKAMDVLVDVVRGEGRAQGRKMPQYLMLGNVTYDHIRAHCGKLLREMDEWEDIAKDLDFDPEC